MTAHRADDLLSLIDDLIRDNNLTCEPAPGNDHCMCSTARALRLLANDQHYTRICGGCEADRKAAG